MDPRAVTVGARVGRRLAPIILVAMRGATDPVAFAGGLIATVVGTIAGTIGNGSAAELLRIALARLDQTPEAGRLELPPGVREAVAAANEPILPIGDILQSVNDDQLEAMRRVLSVVSAKAGIESDKLVELLDQAIGEIRAERVPQ